MPSLQLALVVGAAAGGAALVDVAAPTALHVDSLRAGFALDGARKPTLLLAADGVTIAGHDHGTLDLSSPEAIAEVGATVFADVADEVLNRLGAAASAVRVLVGLSPPAGVTPIAIGALLQDPLAALRAYWQGLVRDHAAAVPAVLTELRNLLADRAGAALGVTGSGSADVPWRIALAGPVVLQAWTVGDRLLFGPAIRFSVDDIGQRCTRIETSLARDARRHRLRDAARQLPRRDRRRAQAARARPRRGGDRHRRVQAARAAHRPGRGLAAGVGARARVRRARPRPRPRQRRAAGGADPAPRRERPRRPAAR